MKDWRDLEQRISISRANGNHDNPYLPLSRNEMQTSCWHHRSVRRGTTIVCLALFPPVHLAETSTTAHRTPTSLLFPSYPHREPRLTVTVSRMDSIHRYQYSYFSKIKMITYHVVWWIRTSLSLLRAKFYLWRRWRWGNTVMPSTTEELPRG